MENVTLTPSQKRELSKVQAGLRLGYLLMEKCQLKEARDAFQEAYESAQSIGDARAMMECLGGLLRLAGEAMDLTEVARLDFELDRYIKEFPDRIPAYAWYCKGSVARHRHQHRQAQKLFHKYLRQVRREPVDPLERGLSLDDYEARGLLMLAMCTLRQGHVRRAEWIGQEILRRFESKKLKSINGTLYLMMGSIAEGRKELDIALRFYQKAHGAFLEEHHWYFHLSALFGYARVARIQQNYPQAYFYLDLIEKAVAKPEFGMLRGEIQAEKGRLEKDVVDLLIDSRRRVIKTRDNGSVALGKQYVLLNILEALSEAHQNGMGEAGLSKAEIIERVWKEQYRPEAHDNKLYYNINRLRKLIEPDMKQPKYLLNWREGYRLAPGLRIHRVSERVQERTH